LAAFEESKALAAEQFQIFGDSSAFQAFQQSERNPRSILRSDSSQNRDRSRSRDSSAGRARFSDSPGNTPRFSRSPKQFGQQFVPAGQPSSSSGRPEWLASSKMNQFTQYANQQQQQQQQPPSRQQFFPFQHHSQQWWQQGRQPRAYSSQAEAEWHQGQLQQHEQISQAQQLPLFFPQAQPHPMHAFSAQAQPTASYAAFSAQSSSASASSAPPFFNHFDANGVPYSHSK
jgi:hypothetical protein